MTMNAHDVLNEHGPSETLVHKIVYEAVMHALKVAQPRLPEAGATPIALNAAIRAATQIDAATADFFKRIEISGVKDYPRQN